MDLNNIELLQASLPHDLAYCVKATPETAQVLLQAFEVAALRQLDNRLNMMLEELRTFTRMYASVHRINVKELDRSDLPLWGSSTEQTKENW